MVIKSQLAANGHQVLKILVIDTSVFSIANGVDAMRYVSCLVVKYSMIILVTICSMPKYYG